MPRRTFPQIDLTGIVDAVIRRNFVSLKEYFNKNNQLLDFRFVTYKASAAANNVKIAHGLGYRPKDVIMTKAVGSGTITFNYSLFDETYLDVSFSDAARFRAFVGTFWDDSDTNDESDTEDQDFKAHP